MSKPEFRNANVLQVLPLRQWIRDNMPTGCEGLVAEDMDLVIRQYGDRYHTDDVGRFMLIEEKRNKRNMGVAQLKTFGLIDKLLRAADPDKLRYGGFHLLHIDYIGMVPIFPVTVNLHYMLNQSDFIKWLEGKYIIPGYFETTAVERIHSEPAATAPTGITLRFEANKKAVMQQSLSFFWNEEE